MIPDAYAPKYHPRWHRRRMSVWWWLESWRYTRFVLRELTSLCVAWTSLVLIGLAWAVQGGSAALASFAAWIDSPWVAAINVLALGGLIFHSVTWFALAPRAMAARLGDRRVPDGVIVAVNLAAWVVVSAALVWWVAWR
jgi:fumarate reductase subunit C